MSGGVDPDSEEDALSKLNSLKRATVFWLLVAAVLVILATWLTGFGRWCVALGQQVEPYPALNIVIETTTQMTPENTSDAGFTELFNRLSRECEGAGGSFGGATSNFELQTIISYCTFEKSRGV